MKSGTPALCQSEGPVNSRALQLVMPTTQLIKVPMASINRDKKGVIK